MKLHRPREKYWGLWGFGTLWEWRKANMTTEPAADKPEAKSGLAAGIRYRLLPGVW